MTDENQQSPLALACPTCKKTIYWTDEYPFRPFCSDRCRLIDLGEWASEGHRIPGKPLDFMQDVMKDDE